MTSPTMIGRLKKAQRKRVADEIAPNGEIWVGPRQWRGCGVRVALGVDPNGIKVIYWTAPTGHDRFDCGETVEDALRAMRFEYLERRGLCTWRWISASAPAAVRGPTGGPTRSPDGADVWGVNYDVVPTSGRSAVR